eukprot:763003-Hanusia_phi.AAC.1
MQQSKTWSTADEHRWSRGTRPSQDSFASWHVKGDGLLGEAPFTPKPPEQPCNRFRYPRPSSSTSGPFRASAKPSSSADFSTDQGLEREWTVWIDTAKSKVLTSQDFDLENSEQRTISS